MKTRDLVLAVFAVASAASAVGAQDIVRGQILDDVPSRSDPSQHYALYVPSNYGPYRKWPVIFGFDAGGRGRRAVERYQAAAEKYGYIVAGSNNSRNGPLEVSIEAATAMMSDVKKRFSIDHARVYTAGMSGGARVALFVALDSENDLSRITGGDQIAGVLASSAGFPDDFHESVPFPIFGSAGTNDFNHEEMIQLNRGLKTPHRLEIFEGTHEWLPVELATDGVEWMEIQAMKKGLRPRDDKMIDDIFARRMARAEAQKSSLDQMRELRSIVADFQDLKDVSAIAKRAAALESAADVKKEIAAEDAEEDRELAVGSELYQLRKAMVTSRDASAKLKARIRQLTVQFKAEKDSSDRRIARRVLSGFASVLRDIQDPELQGLLNQIRPAGQPVQR